VQVVSGQGSLQSFLILIAFVSVPLMLFPKPFLLKRMHEKKPQFRTLEEEAEAGHGGGGGHGHGDHFDFGKGLSLSLSLSLALR
jgi:V-type H+-transporting ATPase subunit a